LHVEAAVFVDPICGGAATLCTHLIFFFKFTLLSHTGVMYGGKDGRFAGIRSAGFKPAWRHFCDQVGLRSLPEGADIVGSGSGLDPVMPAEPEVCGAGWKPAVRGLRPCRRESADR
jgi:hypothetical protein